MKQGAIGNRRLPFAPHLGLVKFGSIVSVRPNRLCGFGSATRTPLSTCRIEEDELCKTAKNEDLIRFAKSRAKKLRDYLAKEGHSINHSQSLEATAHVEGFKDWNTYVARFKLAEQSVPQEPTAPTEPPYPLQVGDNISGSYRGVRFTGVLRGLEKTITNKVWRASIAFSETLEIPGNPALNQTRRRVRLMLDTDGRSVNLKGEPDGYSSIDMP